MTLSIRNTLITTIWFLLCGFVASDSTLPPANKIVFKKLAGAYSPFSYIKTTSVEVRNNKLHILAVDKNGDMLQIKDIPIQKIQNGILYSKDFRTIYISEKNGTHHDDQDSNPNSLLEIKCNSNNPGSPITIGLKTTLFINQKTVRVYATLSGIIPSYTYTEQH
jgi:hypothetical protein